MMERGRIEFDDPTIRRNEGYSSLEWEIEHKRVGTLRAKVLTLQAENKDLGKRAGDWKLLVGLLVAAIDDINGADWTRVALCLACGSTAYNEDGDIEHGHDCPLLAAQEALSEDDAKEKA